VKEIAMTYFKVLIHQQLRGVEEEHKMLWAGECRLRMINFW
jgi:hypothetical protein